MLSVLISKSIIIKQPIITLSVAMLTHGQLAASVALTDMFSSASAINHPRRLPYYAQLTGDVRSAAATSSATGRLQVINVRQCQVDDSFSLDTVVAQSKDQASSDSWLVIFEYFVHRTLVGHSRNSLPRLRLQCPLIYGNRIMFHFGSVFTIVRALQSIRE
jgi:hypothetical protein